MKVKKKEKKEKAALMSPLSRKGSFLGKPAAAEKAAGIVIIRTSDMGWPLS